MHPVSQIGEDGTITKEPRQVLGGKTSSSAVWFAWIRLTSRKQKNGKYIEGWISTMHLEKRVSNKNPKTARSSARRPSVASSPIRDEGKPKQNKDSTPTASSSLQIAELATLANPEQHRRQRVLLRAVLKVVSSHQSHQNVIYPHLPRVCPFLAIPHPGMYPNYATMNIPD